MVREAIAWQLEQWKVGANDLALCGGACGADPLFAEECLRQGAFVRLLLAEKERSMQWEQRSLFMQ